MNSKRDSPPDSPNPPNGVFAELLIEAIARTYRQLLQTGAAISWEAFVLANPEIAAQLETRLQMEEALNQLARRHQADQTGEPASDHQPLAGAAEARTITIGRYAIQENLGGGASAQVYRAFDPRIGRDVALKVFRPDPAMDPKQRARLAHDARAAAKLRHPNIVPVHGVGEDLEQGLCYVEMEWVAGKSLEQCLKEQPDPPANPVEFRAVADLVRKIAGALQHAHDHGVIHRDVKPSNILIGQPEVSSQASGVRSQESGINSQGSGVSNQGSEVCKEEQENSVLLTTEPRTLTTEHRTLTTDCEPQLTDFNLARLVGDGESISLPGDLIGTPAYMSPEQAARRPADARSDIYSLGVVLYRLLTRRLPFPKDDLVTLLNDIQTAEPPYPRALNPAVPRDLETICLKAMAKEPADRFASAADFEDELRRWLNDEPLRVRPPTGWEKARRWARRNRLMVRMIAVSAGLLLLVGGILGYFTYAAHVDRIRANARAAAEEEARTLIESCGLVDRARQRLRQPSQGRRFESQDLLRQAARLRKQLPTNPDTERLDLDIRSTFAASLGVPELKVVDQVRLLRAFSFHNWCAAIHPDGNAVVIGLYDGPIRWTLGQAPAIPGELDTERERPRVWYSPDGTHLLFAPATGGLQLWDETVTRMIKELEPPGASPVLAIGFDREVKTLWACHADGQVQSWSLADFKRVADWNLNAEDAESAEKGRESVTPHFSASSAFSAFSLSITAAAFNADATLLAVGDDSGRVQLFEAKGKPLPASPKLSSQVNGLAWSPDSRLIAAALKDGDVEVWQTDGTRVHLFPAFQVATTVLFSPDGRWLLAGGQSHGLRVWNVTTGEPVLDGDYVPWGFARDERRLVGASAGEVALIDLLAPEAVRELSGHHGRVEHISWSRDHRHLVSLDNRFEVRVWDLQRGTSVYAQRHESVRFFAANAAVALSDDAEQVAFASYNRAFIHEVKTGKLLGEWKLPRGFDRLACTGGRTLLLVREEEEQEGQENWRSVARELAAGKPLSEPRVIRPAVPGERRFLDHGLTPDGRSYWWVGPRQPLENQRVEVYEVAPAQRIIQVPTPAEKEDTQPTAGMSADGRYLWVGKDPFKSCSLYEVGQQTPPAQLPIFPYALAPDLQWGLYRYSADPRWQDTLALYAKDKQQAWLEFRTDPAALRDSTALRAPSSMISFPPAVLSINRPILFSPQLALPKSSPNPQR